jgi:DNA-binding HxlR family transcriptional regulator
MLPRTYDGQNCSVARTLELVGERWSLLIVRDACRGVSRFDDLERSLGIPRSVLAARLERLCECGILERRKYHSGPERFEYVPTERGYDLFPIIAALMQWGDRNAAPAGPPLVMEHAECGGELTEKLTCSRCGADLGARDVITRPGPGAAPEYATL